MEQYELDGRMYERSIQTALTHYRVARVFVRDCGSGMRWVGETKYRHELSAGDRFGIVRDKRGFSVQVNGEEVFFFAVERLSGGMWWGKKWAVAYDRRYPNGRMHIVGRPYENPDDEALPEIKESVLRAVNFHRAANLYHLIEVTFEGKIRLKRVRPDKRMPGWYLWQIIPPP